MRLSLRVRFGRRHIRGIETELESISCSPLQVRIPRVHAPLPVSQEVPLGSRKWNGQPIPPLRSDGRVGRYAPSRVRR